MQLKGYRSQYSVQQARFIRGNHVFDVDEGISTSRLLEDFKRFLNQVPNVLSLLLAVGNGITQRF
jgi:hypothetical protein